MLKRPSGNDWDEDADQSERDVEVADVQDFDEPSLSESELWTNGLASEADIDEVPAEVAEESLPVEALYDESDSLEEDVEEESEGWLSSLMSGDSQAFLFSLVLHTVLILGLALIPVLADHEEETITLTALPAPDAPEELEIPKELAFNEEPTPDMGANSIGETGMALSTASIVADVPEVAPLTTEVPVVTPSFDIQNRIQQSVGLVRSESVVKGMTGEGTTGTAGAVDRITYEILESLEERPTLVVWFFDQSVSIMRRRQEIRDRFDKIYEELGIVQESRKGKDKEKPDAKELREEPLLTSIFAFGDKVSLRTPQPTASMSDIREAIDSIELDATGNEKIFSAFYAAVEKYKSYRANRGGNGPERNVLFIAVTDERGDDINGLDATIKECRKFAIPVYVIGVPAPFGREFAYVKYVDPDPKFDQTPQWAQIDQGPESLMPERVKLGYKDNFYEEPIMDSGFGPYALSRLTYETGGIYFTVHPNRRTNGRVNRGEIEAFSSELQFFFDPEVMNKYRPDYVSREDYIEKAKESPLRQVLVTASQLAAVETLQAPTLRFVRRDEPSFVNELTAAQQQAARLAPQLEQLSMVLNKGQEFRGKETSPRWLAGYDLAVGTVLAHKVRAEAYNGMLAKAKRGISFKNPKNNTWVLKPENEISVGSKLEKEAESAREILSQVVKNHAGTPWAVLAKRELDNPIGWTWVEDFTDLNPPKPANRPNNNNNVPAPAKDDKAQMLKPPPVKRAIPKL